LDSGAIGGVLSGVHPTVGVHLVDEVAAAARSFVAGGRVPPAPLVQVAKLNGTAAGA
jgi:hypothetical protein